MLTRATRFRCVGSMRVAALLVSLGVPLPSLAALCGTILSPVSVTATPVDFGVYDPSTGGTTTANGSVTIACGLSVDALPNFIVSLSQGQAPSYSPRRMVSGVSNLNYNLYTTASHTTIWGDGSGGTSTQSNGGLVVLGSLNFTVYGGILGGQFIRAGAYTDSIVVTVSY